MVLTCLSAMQACTLSLLTFCAVAHDVSARFKESTEEGCAASMHMITGM
eukprot:CAMPEP_0178418662 /NCGR_PEP_ID=MMETSP0689_2-20121128/25206_1 /TAXON_ID=160604 /ORGANISM="Amphidinium massartii, Strain CS-259" /LENGTH=48 /DNA_ID= /DNA_START= /DNA_END= /DNA_ORIENTATION=